MTTIGRTRKRPWTLNECSALAGRCRALLDRIDAFARAFEGTRGLRTATVAALLQVHRKMSNAMMGVADLAAGQLGRRGAEGSLLV